MKKFNVKVNGNAYEVEIEEVKTASAKAAVAVPKVSAPAAPAKPAAAPAQTSVGAGDTPVNAPMPGKIIKLVAEAGKTVKKGEVILILEAMKMQNEISSPADGTLKGFNVAAGQNVKPGEVLAVIG
ncbi:biotin/lipoyl-containing protein [Anaerosinus massiliensis]|uniref:biotin/lipoyl-containing protein n=1 Tax=Massilibacillus massiliensis TaxID=1806837 RepID=UPI000DA60828|nr:biotin/lipoyl-containing protein [Massilibacillus massiliensis]